MEVSMAVFGVVDNSGRMLGVSGIMRDIGARKTVEREQALLSAIVESSDAAIVSLALDFRILSWNAAAEKLLGYPAQEAIGGSPGSVHQRTRIALRSGRVSGGQFWRPSLKIISTLAITPIPRSGILSRLSGARMATVFEGLVYHLRDV